MLFFLHKDFCIVKKPYIIVDSHPFSGSHFVLVEEGNSSSQAFCKFGVPKAFVKFTGKHMCWSLF